MSELLWQKSSHSQEASSCVYVTATQDGTIHLRESDAPDVTLTTTPDRLHALIRTLKSTPTMRAPTDCRTSSPSPSGSLTG
ncbi:DUF397 domain-containing protein [Streptomyces sp. NPDC048441]|uniref:DUF397 domain-containing protein n=1 Tax=Streptomyces sp. NPDC048441 TaxID=3365552 RepID=UPI0037200E7C